MGYIGKVNYNGSTYKVASTLYGTCATAAATPNKVVTLTDFNALETGVTVKVKFTYANGVASPKLNINNTGDIAIMRYGSTAPSTSAATSWNAGSVVSFTYDGTYWQMNDWLNNNDDTTWNTRDYYLIRKAANAIYRYQLCLTQENSQLLAVNTTSNSTSQSKTGFTTLEFNPQGNIYWYATTASYSSGGSINSYNFYTKYYAADLRYSFNNFNSTAASSSFAAYDSLYLVATPISPTRATLYYGANGTTYTACVTKTLPTTEDGLIYIYLGQMIDSYRVELAQHKPVYIYRNGDLRIYGGVDAYWGTSALTPGTSTLKSNQIYFQYTV